MAVEGFNYYLEFGR